MRDIIPHESNPVLRKSAREIAVHDIAHKKIQDLITEMKELLDKEEYGVALAAPQVGESVRLFVVSAKAVERREKKYGSEEAGSPGDDLVYINPKVIKTSRGKKLKHEGCLSVRGKWGRVPRAEKVTIKAYNERGEEFTRGASGLLAHIFQHEMDHLEGILYIDKAKELFDDEK
jgi:peptide deformylase